MRQSVCNAGASNADRSLCVQISRERSYPTPIYWYHSKGNWLRYNFAADSFYIMLIFALDSAPYFYFRSSWPTDIESVSCDPYLTMKVSTKFEVDTTIRCLVIALYNCCWYVTWPCDIDLWPFNLGHWSYMAGHVVNPSTKFEDPTAISSWVMSSDISHRIPLTMRLQRLCMRRITWPMRIEANFSHIFEIPDPDLSVHYLTFLALR